MKVHLPKWAKKFTLPATHKCIYGGRGSGKTWTVAHLIIARAASESIRVACCREFQTSIAVSSKPALEVAIQRLGLSDRFTINQHTIKCVNGSHFFFKGMERNREEIRGWESVDLVWIEEAQRMSSATAELLYPTIRKSGCEIWCTWNPKDRSDYVWQRFILNPRQGDVIHKVNWSDNPWFPKESEAERTSCQRDNPEMYAHIWEGEPDDAGGERKVLPFDLLNACVDAYPKWAGDGRVEMGLDVADSGGDFNALVERRGPCVVEVEKWQGTLAGETVRRVHSRAVECNAMRLYYDSQGVGAGVKSYFNEMDIERDYVVRPVLFGGKVKGDESNFSYRLTNGEMFARRNSQLGWALRLRAQRTKRLMAGEDVDIGKCLFINPKIKKLEEYMAQLSQPAWEENMTGRVTLMKKADGEPSPDMYDATVLAYARDSIYGLKSK